MFGLARTRRPQLPPLSFTRLKTQYALNFWRMEDLRGAFEREMARPGSAVDGYTGTNRFSQKIGWQFHMQSTVNLDLDLTASLAIQAPLEHLFYLIAFAKPLACC